MKRALLCVLSLACLPAMAAQPPKPKLVLAIAVDQFRHDYLTRFRADYKGGLARLLNQGAVFTNARYEHFPTVTAIGHSTFLTGATPSISGIIGNDWWDREAGRKVTSVSDEKTALLGGKGPGASPRRLLVSTLGDELKMVNGGKSRVIGISVKDRSAILPAGHMADAAYWFDLNSGNFVSSTYYLPELPAWVRDFNAARPGERYRGAKWLDHLLPADVTQLYRDLDASPFINEIVEEFAERAIQAEQLGKRGGTDLLSISFSGNDYVGHEFGPDSPEVREVSIRTDQQLDKLFRFLDQHVGLANVLVVLTADHGVAPVPEVNAARKMPGGRMPRGTITGAVQSALERKYGPGRWILSDSEHSLYFDQRLIAEKGLDPAEVNRFAAGAASAVPHVFRVYTRERLNDGAALEDQVGRRVMNGFYAPRSADIYILLEPYWMYNATGTTHGTTFSYDAHVPIIFMAPGIRASRYYEPAAVNDIAPTLAAILEIEIPSGSVGRVLSQIFAP
jgi:predicted AlkP superfamily pyrophosphatase or phosphodiesterase